MAPTVPQAGPMFAYRAKEGRSGDPAIAPDTWFIEVRLIKVRTGAPGSKEPWSCCIFDAYR